LLQNGRIEESMPMQPPSNLIKESQQALYARFTDTQYHTPRCIQCNKV